ncbi:WD40 repeat domain-containing protein [Scytonema hofmannii]|nr:hypothetical protein [Scytonema hofmannii]
MTISSDSIQKLLPLLRDSSPVLAVNFSPDGQTLASVSNMEFQDGNIKLWDIRTGRLRQTLGSSLVSLRTSCVSFSPDGQTLATGHFDAVIRLWHFSSGKQLRTLRGQVEVLVSVIMVFLYCKRLKAELFSLVPRRSLGTR